MRRAVRRWPPDIPDAVWAPLTAAGIMVVVGALGLLFNQPWLFPSLGPTAFLQAETPDHRMARFRHVVLGHLIGLASGFAAVLAIAAFSPELARPAGNLTPARLAASALAVALTILLEVLFRASHPPGVATTMLVTLGVLPMTVHSVLTIAAGVLIVAVIGEGLRRVRLGQVVPHWGDLRATKSDQAASQ